MIDAQISRAIGAMQALLATGPDQAFDHAIEEGLDDDLAMEIFTGFNALAVALDQIAVVGLRLAAIVEKMNLDRQ